MIKLGSMQSSESFGQVTGLDRIADVQFHKLLISTM